MRKIVFLLALTIVTLPSMVWADGYGYGVWHKVLSCQNGAVVVDNAKGNGRGGDGVMAQVVIRDIQTVNRFKQQGAPGRLVDNQWIATSFFEPFQSNPQLPLIAFSNGADNVYYDGSSLTIAAGLSLATFGSCILTN